MQETWIAVRLWLLALCATISLTACGDSPVEQASPTGRLQLALTGSSTSGVQYRLRNGEFTISGASASTASTEDDLQAETISVELKAGEYAIGLSPGWYIGRMTATIRLSATPTIP
ncbi:MAG TPA: hypothetical protein VIV60_24240, partial [Polyangiaceae bacterium]